MDLQATREACSCAAAGIVKVNRAALVATLITKRHDIYTSDDSYDVIERYLKDVMQFLTSQGIILSEEEMVEALGFLYDSNVTDYRLVAELIGFTGDWTLVIKRQLRDLVKTAYEEEWANDCYPELVSDRLRLAKELGADIDPFDPAVGQAICDAAAALYHRYGWGIEEAPHNMEDMEKWGWTPEKIAEVMTSYTPTI